MPWGDPSYVSRDWLSHLKLRHRCDYSTLADFEADEETMLRRVLEQSAREAGVFDHGDADEAEDALLARALEESVRDAAGGVVAGHGRHAGEEELEEDSDDSEGWQPLVGAASNPSNAAASDAPDAHSSAAATLPEPRLGNNPPPVEPSTLNAVVPQSTALPEGAVCSREQA